MKASEKRRVFRLRRLRCEHLPPPTFARSVDDVDPALGVDDYGYGSVRRNLKPSWSIAEKPSFGNKASVRVH